jgi:hypothetical protein
LYHIQENLNLHQHCCEILKSHGAEFVGNDIISNTGCGRKNSLIWEGQSFGWGARHRTAVYVLFSVYTMAWSGEHPAFIVEQFIKK